MRFRNVAVYGIPVLVPPVLAPSPKNRCRRSDNTLAQRAATMRTRRLGTRRYARTIRLPSEKFGSRACGTCGRPPSQRSGDAEAVQALWVNRTAERPRSRRRTRTPQRVRIHTPHARARCARSRSHAELASSRHRRRSRSHRSTCDRTDNFQQLTILLDAICNDITTLLREAPRIVGENRCPSRCEHSQERPRKIRAAL